MSKIVITGAGLLSAAGNSVATTFDALVSRLPFFSDSTERIPYAMFSRQPWPCASIAWKDIPWPSGDSWANNKKYANFAGHAAVAVTQQAFGATAVSDVLSAQRCGIVISVGNTNSVELTSHVQELAVMAENDSRPLATLLFDESPDFSYVRGIPSQIGQFVAIATGFRGSNMVVYGGESSAGGLNALSCAVRMIESGELDRAIVVGVSSPLSLEMLAALEKREPISCAAAPGCGPYDAQRGGVLLGHAAVALVVESESSAQRGGRAPIVELAACTTCCATTIEDAAKAATDAALEQAGYAPDLWWASGSGSIASDKAECLALGERLAGTPISCSKGNIGESFECSGLVDVALAMEALERKCAPPIGLLQTADPALGALDFVTGTSRNLPDMESVLVTAVGLGGSTSAGAVMVSRCQE